MKSPIVLNKLQGIADKLTGTTRVNNAADPTSAYSMSLRKQQNTKPNSPAFKFATKQTTFGTPAK